MAEKTRLVTASLLNSIDWMQNAPSSVDRATGVPWNVKAYSDLKATLAREPFKATPEIQRGMDFENKVNEHLKRRDALKLEGKEILYIGDYHEELETLKWFLDHIPTGSQQQKVFKKFPEIDGKKYCVYCKTDLYQPGKLQDVKTTQSYKPGKYLSTSQHILYMWASEEEMFEYLIAVFDKTTQKVVGTEYEVFVLPHEVQYPKLHLEAKVFKLIRDMEKFFVRYPELGTLYEEKFCRY